MLEDQALCAARQVLRTLKPLQVAALGHRVVHGKSISEPVLIDDAALAAIQDAAELAPLCAPPCLLCVVAMAVST